MVEITLSVPKDLSEFVHNISKTIYVEALKEVAGRKLSHTQRHLKELLEKSSMYE